MAEDVLLIEKNDRVTTLTLNRPDAMNALSFELRSAMTTAFRELSDDPDTGVIILERLAEVIAQRLQKTHAYVVAMLHEGIKF